MTSENFAPAIPHLTYFPFIGWFFPMIMKKDDSFLMFHARQGFVLAAFFAVYSSLLFIATGLVSAGIVKFVFVAGIYAGYIFYLMLCIAGWLQIKKGSEKNFPFFSKYTERIEI